MSQPDLIVLGSPEPTAKSPPTRGGRWGQAVVALAVVGLVVMTWPDPPTPATTALATPVPATVPLSLPSPTQAPPAYNSPLEGGSLVEFPGQGMLVGVAAGPNGLLAAGITKDSGGASFLWMSAGGHTWNYIVGSADYFRGVRLTGLAATNDGYSAVGVLGEAPAAWFSADGATWERAGGLPSQGGLHRVEWVGERLVGLGWEGEGIDLEYPPVLPEVEHPRLWVSEDGRQWEAVALGDRSGWFADIEWIGRSLIVAGSENGEGRVWADFDLAGIQSWFGVDNPALDPGWGFVSLAVGPESRPWALARNRNDPSGPGTLLGAHEGFGWQKLGEAPRRTNWIYWGPTGELLAGAGPTWLGYRESELFVSPDGLTWHPFDGLGTFGRLTSWQSLGDSVYATGSIEDEPRLWQWPARSSEVVLPSGP